MNTEKLIESFIELNRENNDIKGAVLLGSVAYKADDARSDIDITVIYEGNKPQMSIPESKTQWDISLMDMETFKNLKEPDWRIYAFLVSKVLIDNTGLIKEHVDGLRRIDEKNIEEKTAASLDGYLNGFYRTMKALRRGDKLGANLELAIGMRFLIKSIYYMNGLIAPYEDRLRVALHLLKKSPYEGKELLIKLEEALLSIDPSINSRLFLDIERFYRAEGYGEVYDDWENTLTDELIMDK